MDFNPNPDFAGFLQLLGTLLILVGFIGGLITIASAKWRNDEEEP